MVSTFSTVAFLMAGAGMGCGHPRARAVVVACEPCAVPTTAAVREIDVLEHAPRWRDRERAARDLRSFDRDRHPEVVAALVNALRNDCAPEVREEAAVSLGRIEACVAIAHETLRRAADLDPDLPTRKAARRALKRLDRRCAGDCAVCDGAAVVGAPQGVIVPGPTSEEPALAAPTDAPPSDLPMPLPEAIPDNGPTTDNPDLEPPSTPSRGVTETRAERPRLLRLIPLPGVRERLAAARRGGR